MNFKSLSALFRFFQTQESKQQALLRDHYRIPVAFFHEAISDIIVQGDAPTAGWLQMAEWIRESATAAASSEDRQQMERLGDTLFIVASILREQNVDSHDVYVEKTVIGNIWHYQPFLLETEKYLRTRSRRWFTTNDNVAHMIPRDTRACRYYDDARSYFELHRAELLEAQEKMMTVADLTPPNEALANYRVAQRQRIDVPTPPVKTNAHAVFISDPASATRHFYSRLSRFFTENPQIGQDYHQQALISQKRPTEPFEGIPLNLG